MHVAIVSTRSFPDQDVYAREQSAALRQLGVEVTVIAPASPSPRWPIADGVRHVAVNPSAEPSSWTHRWGDIGADVAHVYEYRFVSRLLQAIPVPTALEVRSAPLRPPLTRGVGIARMLVEARFADIVGSPNELLVHRWPVASFVAPAGWSSWAVAARRQRAPIPGRLLFQGSLEGVVRLDRLLQAVQYVMAARTDARLVVIGRDDPRNLDPKGLLAGSLADRVDVMSAVGPDELAAAMASAHVALGWKPCSNGHDGQPPLKVLDALAAGVPVVATLTRGNRALLERGRGILADDDPTSFAKGIRTAIEGPLEADVDEAFLTQRSWASIMERSWLARYEALLSGSRP